jgi:hypothetical protein
MLRMVLATGLLLLAACGGRTVEDGSGEGEGEGGAGGAGGAGAGGTGGRGGSGTGGPKTPLPQCVLGDPPFESALCPWMAEQRCYLTKEAACACICPTDRPSYCISGLPGGPNDAIDVQCD